MAMSRTIVRIAGVVGAGFLVTAVVFTRAGSAGTPECWVDVFNDFVAGDDTGPVAGAFPATADQAVEQGLADIEADAAVSRRRGGRDGISDDPKVFVARRALYANARQADPQQANAAPGTKGSLGLSEWQWAEDGRTKGVIVMEQVPGGWRILEEHFLVGDGPCGA